MTEDRERWLEELVRLYHRRENEGREMRFSRAARAGRARQMQRLTREIDEHLARMPEDIRRAATGEET